MNKKKQLARRKLKKVASQPWKKKVIPSSSSNERLGVQYVPQWMETPLSLLLPLMALFKAMVPMPGDHNILIPVDDATFELPVENICISKEDVF